MLAGLHYPGRNSGIGGVDWFDLFDFGSTGLPEKDLFTGLFRLMTWP